MIIAAYDLREYLQKELEGIDDYGTLHELFCTLLHHRGVPYGTLRRARLREQASQLHLFSDAALR